MTGWGSDRTRREPTSRREYTAPTAALLRQAADLLDLLAVGVLAADLGADQQQLSRALADGMEIADQLHSWAEALDAGVFRWQEVIG